MCVSQYIYICEDRLELEPTCSAAFFFFFYPLSHSPAPQIKHFTKWRFQLAASAPFSSGSVIS